MKKIFFTVLILLVLPRVAHSYGCITQDWFNGCPSAEDLDFFPGNNPNCRCNNANPPICRITDVYRDHCPRWAKRCTCNDNLTGTVDPVTGVDLGSGGQNPGGGGGGDDCDEPLPCTACVDTGWESYGTGYEIKKTGGTCVNNSCTSYGECINQTIEYRCASGYCGTSTDGQTGCVKTTMSASGCRVMDKFEFECPDGVENCMCTNTYPKICSVLDIFDTLPSWATNYICGYNVWTTTATGYEKQTIATFENGSCTAATTSYRCANGYYGTSTNGTSGCTQCPSPGTSTAATNTSITQCYISAGKELSDVTGKYAYTQNCYYK